MGFMCTFIFRWMCLFVCRKVIPSPGVYYLIIYILYIDIHLFHIFISLQFDSLSSLSLTLYVLPLLAEVMQFAF